MELIVYLEPPTQVKQIVNGFLDTVASDIAFTTANKYECHVSMTGFFQIEQEHQIQKLKNMLEVILQREICSSPELDMCPLLVRDKITDLPAHLLLPVTVSDDYRQRIFKLAEEAGEKLHINIRPKRINHISLAYWDEKEEKDCTKLFEMIKSAADSYFLQYHDISSCSSEPWHIVLYQRTFKNEVVGGQHRFKEISRWPILQN